MQPNQQEKPMPGQEGPPSYSGVPDFLQLDTSESAQKKSKTRLSLLIIVIVVLLGSAAAAALAWVKNDPERQFYDALDTMMQTSYLKRDTTVDLTSSKGLIAGHILSDCSDPTHCKNQITYELPQSDNPTDIIKGEEFITNNEYFTRMIGAPAASLSSTVTLNQWYRVTNSKPSKIYNRLNLDTDQGVIFSGNLNAAQRQQMLDFIKSNATYTIQNSSGMTLNGEAATLYKVNTSLKKVQEANAKFASLLNITKIDLSQYSDISDLQIWVSNATHKILRVSLKPNIGRSTVAALVQVNYGYPKTITVTEPTNAKNFSQ